MAVLTSLSQFEQYDLETAMCEVTKIGRDTAGKILAAVFVPELDKAVRAAVARALDQAAADVERMDRIQKTALDDVPPADLTWSRAPQQTPIRDLTSTNWRDARPALAEWLRDRAIRGGTP